MKRLLITGAAGSLGRVARAGLAGAAEVLRVSDVDAMDPAADHEEVVACDLGDADGVMRLVEGCDAIVHFGGVSTERAFDPINRANIAGVFNLYEAARAHGTRRIFFASSNHATGFYRRDQVIDGSLPPICDGLYGASKVYGEQLALLYWHKFGIETARVRIGSCFPKPRNRRMLDTWMSPGDLLRLTRRVLEVETLGCPVIYGVSANRDVWWDNSAVAWLGWEPQDSSEPWRAELEAKEPEIGSAPEDVYQGGGFVAEPIYRE